MKGATLGGMLWFLRCPTVVSLAATKIAIAFRPTHSSDIRSYLHTYMNSKGSLGTFTAFEMRPSRASLAALCLCLCVCLCAAATAPCAWQQATGLATAPAPRFDMGLACAGGDLVVFGGNPVLFRHRTQDFTHDLASR